MSDYIKKHGEVIPQDTRTSVSLRYRTITRAINNEFWSSASDTAHSFYVGSYGRGTAIDTSDIDILVEIPQSEYQRYDYYRGNGQSRLLQAVKNAILTSYPRTDIRADGQVVKVSFSDGMQMEILPAFPKQSYWGYSEGYTYPDANDGGRWLSTNPKLEQDAMKAKNDSSNGLLFDTCRHIRYVRDNYFSSYHLSGIVIDSFVYSAIQFWTWTQPGSTSSAPAGDYERHLLQIYQSIFPAYTVYHTIQAPGSNQSINANSSVDCLGKVMRFIAQ